jgi:YD repeat-containing protein
VKKYTYNELSELTREDNQVLGKSIKYTYDVGGNITSKAEYPYTTGTLGSVTKTYSYAYNDTSWKDLLSSFDGKAITYDAIGNPIAYNGGSFNWQSGRQLKNIKATGKDISYKYNDGGIRTEKTVNGITTKYRLVGDKVINLRRDSPLGVSPFDIQK